MKTLYRESNLGAFRVATVFRDPEGKLVTALSFDSFADYEKAEERAIKAAKCNLDVDVEVVQVVGIYAAVSVVHKIEDISKAEAVSWRPTATAS